MKVSSRQSYSNKNVVVVGPQCSNSDNITCDCVYSRTRCTDLSVVCQKYVSLSPVIPDTVGFNSS